MIVIPISPSFALSGTDLGCHRWGQQRSRHPRGQTYHALRRPSDSRRLHSSRVERTARASHEGEAITMVGRRDIGLFLAIEARVGQKMDAFDEQGVNVDMQMIRDELQEVGERTREAMLVIEEGSNDRVDRDASLMIISKLLHIQIGSHHR
ncbi:putative RNA helicase [Pseudocyphellaria aurata]|nr:putative RNA helicase [Pseudocyphellaria aurata]